MLIAMGMRFSLKWLLVAMIYAAFVAAAFAQGHWAYADLLWAATFFALTYALTSAIVARGQRQGGAIGFATAVLLILACLHFNPNVVPTSRVATALAAPQPAVSYYTAAMPTPRAAPQWVTAPATTAPVVPPTAIAPSPQAYAPYSSGFRPAGSGTVVTTWPTANPYEDAQRLQARIRSANAVTAMSAGLIGAILGAVAARRAAQAKLAPISLAPQNGDDR